MALGERTPPAADESVQRSKDLTYPGINELARPKWGKVKYQWRLENFHQLRAMALVDALEDQNGSLIWSQRFGSAQHGSWQLKLYPYGDRSQLGRQHISLFLSLDLNSVESRRAYAIFGCHLVGADGQKIPDTGRSITRQRFTEGSSSWGWSQFLKVDQTLKRYLVEPNDSLIIMCEVDMFLGIMPSPGPSFPQSQTWEMELKRYLSPDDCTIKFANGQRTLQGSTVVMSARSGWFREAFQGMKLSTGSKIEDSEPPTTAIEPPPGGTTKIMKFGHYDEDEDEEPEVLPPSPQPTTSSSDSLFAPESYMPHLIARSTDPLNGHITLTIGNADFHLLDNCVSFIHNDFCPMLGKEVSVAQLLGLLTVAYNLQIESLQVELSRKLSIAIIDQTSAHMVVAVAGSLGLTELYNHASVILLSCQKQTDPRDSIVKTLLVRSSSSTTPSTTV